MAKPFATNLFGQERDDVGNWASAYDLAKLRAEFNALVRNRPGARARASAAVSHTTSGQYQAVAFDTRDWDNDGIHDTATNNSRFTVRTAGKYWVYGNVRFAGNSTGVRIVGIRKNGVTTASPTHGTVKRSNLTIDSVDIMVGSEVDLAVGDWVEIVAWQNTGAALNMDNINGALHGGVRWEGQ